MLGLLLNFLKLLISMEIRKLTPADAPLFQAMRLYALQEAPLGFGASLEDETDKPLSWYAATLAPSADKSVLGAFSGAELLGVVGFSREEPLKFRHKGYIWTMYVAPASRGTGLGRKLLEAAITLARATNGIRHLTLCVNADNETACRLYRALGFVPFAVERAAIHVAGKYYDETRMQLML